MYKNLIELQPNRSPFLFIDEISNCEIEKTSTTVKYLDPNEWFFKCHWENDPNMPAMLQLEMMSQTASLCLFSKSNPPKKLYLTSIKSASFRKKIIPNMNVETTSFLISKVRNIYTFKCTIRDSRKKNLISKSYLDLFWPDKKD